FSLDSSPPWGKLTFAINILYLKNRLWQIGILTYKISIIIMQKVRIKTHCTCTFFRSFFGLSKATSMQKLTQFQQLCEPERTKKILNSKANSERIHVLNLTN